MIDCVPHLHVAAIHGEAGYNDDTPGLGVLCKLDPDLLLAAGVYHNSNRKQSEYLGLAYRPLHIGPVKLGVFSAVVSGYKIQNLVMAAGVASVTLGKVEAHLIAAPGVPGFSPPVAQLSLSLAF